MNLSKSLYTKGIQCPKALWLKKYKKEVLTPPDASALARFEAGNIVGDLACKLFAGGKEVPYDTSFGKMIALTKQWIDDGMKSIYEATFDFDGILVMIDILCIDNDGVRIYEVKSSTSLKDIYLHDVSIQHYVLENLGFNIKSANVVHINSSYVRGDRLDINELFKIADVTDEIKALQKNIPLRLLEFESYLKDKENEPDIAIGKHCKTPYECDAFDYCWRVQRDIPKYSIFNIFNIGSKKQIELYSKGIVDIGDIPDNFDMTANQAQAVQIYKTKQTYIDKESIRKFIGALDYPIYHLDFETFQQVVPLWRGISPFEQIPFQYSLHIKYEDGRVEHKEFLADEEMDPRWELAKKLCEDIPQDATVLAYNMSFEKGVIKKLALNYEELGSHLLNINENMKDLMIPFAKKWYVTPEMQGSYSIKYVLPALIPKMAQAYQELKGVKNGSDAMNVFANLSKMENDEKEKMRSSLLQYCKLDTLAMVKILEKLKSQ